MAAELGRHAWVDASAGVAGDMLLGALLDLGADLGTVQRAVDAVVPGSVAIRVEPVTRAGLRATHVRVEALVDDPPHRTWRSIRTMIEDAGLGAGVRDRALAVFTRLAEAEARVHGIAVEDVHFHEVGALDSLADVVGVCAALGDLGVRTVSAGEVAVGSGRVRTAHGSLPVPVPAVTELARDWRIRAGGSGEQTTPTGMALIAALAERCEVLPSLTVDGVGVGGGSRDTPGQANVTRVILGVPTADTAPGADAIVLEANLDDLDPRLWPGVLDALLAAGADDAWLTPILMKKGRPAHLLSALAPPDKADDLTALMTTQTSTLGVRRSTWTKYALPRQWVSVDVDGARVRIKIGHRGGVIVQATPEFGDVAVAAARLGRSEQQVLTAAVAAAAAAGLRTGAELRTGPPSKPDPAHAQ